MFEVVEEVLTFTAGQLGLDARLIDLYRRRQQTISEHQRAIVAYLGLRHMGDAETAALERFVFEEACRLEPSAALQSRAQEFLKEQAVLEPAEFRIGRIVGEQRKLAREQIFERVAAGIPSDLAPTLENLLVVGPEENVSSLQAVKANPGKPSGEAMLALLAKLGVIKGTGVLGVDLAWLSGNYQRALFHHVRKSSVHRLRELADPRRRAAVVCFLWQSYRDAVDQAVEMFDKLLTRTCTHAQHEIDAQLCRQRQTIQASLGALRSLGRIILDDAVSDAELRATLFAAVPRDELAARVENLSEWVTGKHSDLFHGVIRRYGALRKFSTAWLEALEFTQDAEGEETACLRALRVLKQLNVAGRRKLPADAPTDFLPPRLQAIVVRNGELDRRAWECGLLLKLRDEIKAGNLSVRYSKRFARLDDFFIDDRQWASMREEFFRRSGLPADPKEVPAYLSGRLATAYDRFVEAAPSNSYPVIDEQGWAGYLLGSILPGRTHRLR